MIPKILHRIWLGGEPPAVYNKFLDRWRSLHPDWEIKLWGDEDFGWLRNQRLFDSAADYVPADAVFQMKSDVARYEILLDHGGVYVDADTEPLKSFDPLLGAEAFAGWEVPGKFIANGTIGAVPNHPFIRRVVERLPSWADENKGRAATFVSGPRLFTGLYFSNQPNIVVHPKKTFYPYIYDELTRDKNRKDPASLEYPDSFSVHHWNHKREQRGLVGRLSSVNGI